MGSAELAVANRLEEKLLQATEEKEEPTDRPTEISLREDINRVDTTFSIHRWAMGDGEYRIE